MTSKSTKRRDILDVIKDTRKEQRRANGINRQNFSGLASADFGSVSMSASGGGSLTSSSSDTTERLKTGGDTMIGPIAFSTKTQILSGGILDVSKSTGTGYSSYVIVSAASGTHDLNTISGAQFNGQLLFLDAPATVTVRLKHNIDNIFIPDGVDFDIVPNSVAILIYDYTITKWNFVCGFVRDTTGGGGGANQTLSNLTSPTAINQHLLFSSTGFDIGDSTNPVNNLFVEELRLKIGTVVTNIPMLTAIDANSMKLNVNTTGKISFTVLNSEVGKVDASGFSTSFNLNATGTGTFGGTLVSGSHFSSSSTTTSLISSATTTIRSTIININATGSNTTNIGSVTGGAINLYNSPNLQGNDITGVTDISIAGRIKYTSDPTNTYIDIASGGGDITLNTNGGSDHINLVASGAGSNIVIDANSTGSITLSLSGVALQTITSSLTSFLTNHVRLPNKSDASRGAASLAGRIIYNTSDGKINIDNGTNWTLADGTVT